MTYIPNAPNYTPIDCDRESPIEMPTVDEMSRMQTIINSQAFQINRDTDSMIASGLKMQEQQAEIDRLKAQLAAVQKLVLDQSEIIDRQCPEIGRLKAELERAKESEAYQQSSRTKALTAIGEYLGLSGAWSKKYGYHQIKEAAHKLKSDLADANLKLAVHADAAAQLQTIHVHVKESLELLGVDVSVDGYVPDSWTLREQCKIAGERLAAANAGREACIAFIKNEITWLQFRAEFNIGTSGSQENISKLKQFLDSQKFADVPQPQEPEREHEIYVQMPIKSVRPAIVAKARTDHSPQPQEPEPTPLPFYAKNIKHDTPDIGEAPRQNEFPQAPPAVETYPIQTVQFDVTETERAAIKRLSEHQQLTEQQIMRQALRLYESQVFPVSPPPKMQPTAEPPKGTFSEPERCGIKHKFHDGTCIREKGHEGVCRSKGHVRDGYHHWSEWHSEDGQFVSHVGYQQQRTDAEPPKPVVDLLSAVVEMAKVPNSDAIVAPLVRRIKSGIIDLQRRAEAAESDLEQHRVQLAGCLTAAEGATNPEHTAKQGDYGWSLPYQRTLELHQRIAELETQLDKVATDCDNRGAEIVRLQQQLAKEKPERGRMSDLLFYWREERNRARIRVKELETQLAATQPATDASFEDRCQKFWEDYWCQPVNHQIFALLRKHFAPLATAPVESEWHDPR